MHLIDLADNSISNNIYFLRPKKSVVLEFESSCLIIRLI